MRYTCNKKIQNENYFAILWDCPKDKKILWSKDNDLEPDITKLSVLQKKNQINQTQTTTQNLIRKLKTRDLYILNVEIKRRYYFIFFIIKLRSWRIKGKILKNIKDFKRQ